jgi:hypothetical protein
LKTGKIKNILDKQLGFDLLDSSEPLCSDVILKSGKEIKRGETSARIENGPIRKLIVQNGRIEETSYQCQVAIYNDIKRIEINLETLGLKGHITTNTELNAVFKPSFSGTIHVNGPFGIYKTQRKNHFALDFTDFSNGKKGLTFIHRNLPFFNFKDKKFHYILSSPKSVESPRNQGPFTEMHKPQRWFHALYSHKGDHKDGRVLQASIEFNNPLITVISNIQKAILPPTFSFLNTDKNNLILSALFQNNNNLIIRVYESQGQNSTINISFHGSTERFVNLEEIALDGKPIRRIEVKEDSFILSTNSWKITTLKAKLNQKDA